MMGYADHLGVVKMGAVVALSVCVLAYAAIGREVGSSMIDSGGEGELGGQAGDWPQFRYDAGRTAASPHSLPDQLKLRWTRALPAPRPAYPNEIRLAFDASYEPVVLGDTMFVPSMVTDSVTALDTGTGEERWCFFAEGPVRFAPVAWEDKVYFVSDDGYLYCVDAGDGSLLWRFRGLPADRQDRRVMGDGRMVSLWPARGGPVLSEGVIYFAAGLFPTEGVFVHAVDAQSGKAVWSNTNSDLIPESNWDHGIGFDSGLTPQGYLAIVGDKLVVPNGAQLAAFLDLETGELQQYTMGWGGRVAHPKGTWFVAGIGNYLVHGGDLYDITRPYEERVSRPGYGRWLHPGGLTRLDIDPANQRPLYDFRQPVLTREAMYESGPDGIRARDLTSFTLRNRNEVELPLYRREDVHPDTFVAEFDQLWEWSSHPGGRLTREPVDAHWGRWDSPSHDQVHLKAGSRLYTGAPGFVQALEIADDGEPEVVWRAAVEGEPHRMLAADGKLFVVTDGGNIHAFVSAEDIEELREKRPNLAVDIENPPYLAPRAARIPDRDEWTGKAAAILAATGVRDGYALVLGLDGGRLVEELVRQSDLHVIAVDEDPDQVDSLRQRLHEAGVYGSRAAVLTGDPGDYPFPPFLAGLIVFEDAGVLREDDRDAWAGAVFHALRPYGGVACVPVQLAARDDVQQAFEGEAFPGAFVREDGGYVLVSREGALPGAADWSHEQANAASTGASEDQRVGSDLGVLWFDGRHRWHKFWFDTAGDAAYRSHETHRYPGHVLVRVAGGRRILLEEGLLHAADVYTGRTLWEAEVPVGVKPLAQARARDAIRLQRQRRWSPPAGLSPATEIVALEDAVYVSEGTRCLVFDAATGEYARRIDLPSDLQQPWANLRVTGRYLVGTSGQHLLCVDRHTGDVLWDMEMARPELSVAVGGGKVFCAEMANLRRGEDETSDGSTRALDLATGQTVWERDGGAALRYSPSHDILVTPVGFYCASDGSLLKRPADPEQRRWIVVGRERPDPGAPGLITSGMLITGSDQSLFTYELPSGKPLAEEPLQWVRRGCTDTRASERLLTTRYRSNSAWIDLATGQITPFLAVRPGCTLHNNLFPANGVLSMPNLTGGCTCNFLPVSVGLVPVPEIMLRRTGME
ncbi:MAG: hypothetical protein EA424_04530 [Planctomycetaceae bacterium]|nr:MAG: hypothetical protein EA424_04530 [Planctomycetaceae bacterium]